MKHKFFVILAAVALIFFTASCEKDNVPPTVPSIDTVVIDLDQIPMTTTKAPESNPSTVYHSFLQHWRYIHEQLVNLPAKCFEIVSRSEPVRDGHVWTWEYKGYSFYGQTYNIVLLGEERGRKVEWTLQVTSDGYLGHQDYTWITGWSMKDGSEGHWEVSVGPNDLDVKVLSDWKVAGGQVQYVRTSYDLKHAISFVGEFFNNSYVEYRNSATDSAYTESLFIHYSQIGNISSDISIEWNGQTHECRAQLGGQVWSVVTQA